MLMETISTSGCVEPATLQGHLALRINGGGAPSRGARPREVACPSPEARPMRTLTRRSFDAATTHQGAAPLSFTVVHTDVA